MSNHCPFPVRSTDNRSCYRSGSTLGFTLGLALMMALSGYAGSSHADAYSIAPDNEPEGNVTTTRSLAHSYLDWTGLHESGPCCGLVSDAKTPYGEQTLRIGLSKSRAWLSFRW